MIAVMLVYDTARFEFAIYCDLYIVHRSRILSAERKEYTVKNQYVIAITCC